MWPTFGEKPANYAGGEQQPFQMTACVLNNNVAFAAAAEDLRTLPLYVRSVNRKSVPTRQHLRNNHTLY